MQKEKKRDLIYIQDLNYFLVITRKNSSFFALSCLVDEKSYLFLYTLLIYYIYLYYTLYYILSFCNNIYSISGYKTG